MRHLGHIQETFNLSQVTLIKYSDLILFRYSKIYGQENYQDGQDNQQYGQDGHQDGQKSQQGGHQDGQDSQGDGQNDHQDCQKSN